MGKMVYGTGRRRLLPTFGLLTVRHRSHLFAQSDAARPQLVQLDSPLVQRTGGEYLLIRCELHSCISLVPCVKEKLE